MRSAFLEVWHRCRAQVLTSASKTGCDVSKMLELIQNSITNRIIPVIKCDFDLTLFEFQL